MTTPHRAHLSASDAETRFHFPAAGGGITGSRLLNGPSAGIDLVQLDTGPLQVWIVPTRGMGIWRAELNGIPVGWQSPVRHLVHPRHVNLQSRNGLGWLDGFNELVCRCGLSSNGPPGNDPGARSPIESDLTLHGRIANIPAHDVEARIEGDRLICEGRVAESTLFGPQLHLHTRIEATLGSQTFEIVDEITNHGSTPTELELLYHTNIGPPFLEKGSTVAIPHRQVAPRDARAAEGIDTHTTYLGPTSGYAEQAYFYEPLAAPDGRTIALLKNAAGDRGFSVDFAIQELPRFVVWKCTQPEQDGNVTGLEPATNFPNHKSFERTQGRVIALAPKATYCTSLKFGLYSSPDAVHRVEQTIAGIQGTTNSVIHKTPHPEWSPA